MNYESLIPKWKKDIIQTNLFEGNVSKMVRNISYEQVINDKDTDRQRDIVESIIDGHPEGVTDTELCILSGIQKSSVTARRNEIAGVEPISIAIYTGVDGRTRFNTLWGKA